MCTYIGKNTRERFQCLCPNSNCCLNILFVLFLDNRNLFWHLVRQLCNCLKFVNRKSVCQLYDKNVMMCPCKVRCMLATVIVIQNRLMISLQNVEKQASKDKRSCLTNEYILCPTLQNALQFHVYYSDYRK